MVDQVIEETHEPLFRVKDPATIQLVMYEYITYKYNCICYKF